MNMPSPSNLIALAVLLALPNVSHAQIVLTPGVAVTGDESVLTTGTEVFGGTQNGAFTLNNGVTFGSSLQNAVSVASTIPGSTVKVDSDGASFGDQTGNLGFTDSNLNNALAFNSATGGQLFFYITGLTPGDRYLTQYFAALTTAATGGNINGNGSFNAVETVSHEEGFFTGVEATTTLPYGRTADPANPGMYLDSGAFTGTDTFTANAAGTAFIQFSNSTNGIDLDAAVQIRDLTTVPEPSTYALMFGAIGMLVLASRFRKLA
jgi:hypothetical protein